METKFCVDKEYEPKVFLNFLEGFLPFDFDKIDKPLDGKELIKGGRILGESKELKLTVYEFEHESLHDPRVSLTREVLYIMKNFSKYPNALVVLYNKNSVQWRLSYVVTDAVYDEVTDKIRWENSNPRRFSFLLGEKCKKHTPESMLIHKGAVANSKDLLSRFDIEVVTKEFYNELFKWYESAQESVKFPEKNSKGKNVVLSLEDNPQHLIRLITRLMFVWFIKQKKLIPSWIFDETKLQNILIDFDPTSSKSGTYYNGVLQNLFFATLNQKIENRTFTDDTKEDGNPHYGIKTLYRDCKEKSYFKKSKDEIKGLFESVPFLNGGLFECLDRHETEGNDKKSVQYYIDGFSREKSRCAFIPNILFWNSTHGEQEGLVHILDRYNFTVEENTPSDIDVALDPELLGKVFENLLGTYNPETKETARKESGSFYTPREIVNYMVDESLIAHLKSKLPDLSDDDIRQFFSETEGSCPESITDKKDKISEYIKAIKVLDPACGSGAFPMGILNRMVQLLQKLDANTKDLYKLKQELIENCIYGVDIQPIAVQISKLRFFISLICEQQKTKDSTENYGFNPLPNLETKFVAANTLIGLDTNVLGVLDYNDDLMTLRHELFEVRRKHFSARTADEKKQLREEDKKLRKQIIEKLTTKACCPDYVYIQSLEQEISSIENEIENLPVEIVDDTDTSPDLFGESKSQLFSYDKNEDKRKDLRNLLRVRNKKLKAELSKKNTDELKMQLEQLAKWDPYNQNETSPFFDSEWMFGVSKADVDLNPISQNEKKTGYFDVVIGNPPYVLLQNTGISKDIIAFFISNYYSAQYKIDLYHLFIEFGLKALSDNGVLAYITPISYLKNKFNNKLREFIVTKGSLVKVVRFFIPIFEKASVDNSIIICIKSTESNSNVHFIDVKDKNTSINSIEPVMVDQNSFTPNNYYIDVKNNDDLLLTKIISNRCLKEFASAYFGIQTFDRKSYVNSTPIDNSYVPVVDGANVHKYFLKPSNEYVCFQPSAIKSGGNHMVYKRERILIRQINRYPQGCICPANIFTLNTIYNIYLKTQEIDIKFLLALINSKVISYYWNSLHSDSKETFPKVKKDPLESIPIKVSDKQQLFIEKVDQILELKKDNPKADTSGIETEIDQLVYKLYNLTDEEVKIIEEK